MLTSYQVTSFFPCNLQCITKEEFPQKKLVVKNAFAIFVIAISFQNLSHVHCEN